METGPSIADILADLNEPQRQAVTHGDGPLLVLAGPGSGKTRVITRRAAHLVATGTAPHNVLALTFTNKATEEMKRRIEALGCGRGMWVYTFHALGVRLLREFGALARVRPGFTIYDEADRMRVVKEAMLRCGVSDNVVQPAVVQARISHAKSKLESPAECAGTADFFEQRTVARVYEEYERILTENNAVDFDDLLMRVALLLRENPDVAERLNRRFRSLLIDEYQDTNHAQYLIARYLSQHHRNVCATGDPDQSIYGWRGADIRNILEFERDYPEAVVIRLEQNYRSTGHILRIADSLIANNRGRRKKRLWTDRGDGAKAEVWGFAEGSEEAERIADAIVTLRSEGRDYSDIAICYRINVISRGLEDSLRSRGIPYRIARGVEFYNRKEIRDVVGYLRLLVNPADTVALLRIINTPARGIGKTTILRLRDAAAENGWTGLEAVRRAHEVANLHSAVRKLDAFAELIDTLRMRLEAPVSTIVSDVLRLSGLEAALQKEDEDGGEDRLANVQELVTVAARYDEEADEPSLEAFLQSISLTSDQDAIDESAGCVILMTLHAAKGLEFPVVFLVGLEQGMLPHERALRENTLEEERRLCFVGITRARERLILSHAQERFLRGMPVPRSRSQFLAELDESATEEHDFGTDQWLAPRRRHEPDDGFVPMDDHLPLDERPRRRPRRKTAWRRSDGFKPDPDEQIIVRATQQASRDAGSTYADWTPGTLVQHTKYGPGQVVWIRPGGGQTRASIRFPAYGEKTFILELAPITRLQRSR